MRPSLHHAWVIIAAFAAAACSLDVDASGAGKACEKGRCAAGYVCSATNRCVVDLSVSPPDAAAGGTTGNDGAETGGIKVGPTNPPEGTGGSTGHSVETGGAGVASSPGSGGAAGAPLADAGVDPTNPMDGSADATPADANCGLLKQYYSDHDGDGFGLSANSRWLCAPMAGWTTKGGDCNDDEALVFPGQTKYFTVSYTQYGVESFDYDCSGREEPDPAAMGLAPDCPALALLVCGGSGFVGTGRKGDGVDSTCGSATVSMCSGLLACAATSSPVPPKGCR